MAYEKANAQLDKLMAAHRGRMLKTKKNENLSPRLAADLLKKSICQRRRAFASQRHHQDRKLMRNF